jgi:hypothetical protein
VLNDVGYLPAAPCPTFAHRYVQLVDKHILLTAPGREERSHIPVGKRRMMGGRGMPGSAEHWERVFGT